MLTHTRSLTGLQLKIIVASEQEEKGAEMVDLDLKALAAPIEALRSDVDAAYKRLDAKWKAIAKQLGSLPIPCTVGYCYEQHPEQPECFARLEWRKWNGSRRICIVQYDVDRTNGGDWVQTADVTPFEEWGGEQRVEMLRYVPSLFDAAAKQTKEFIERTKEEKE